MNEPIILSPLEFPFVWVAFVLNWGGAVACVLFAFRLWQATSARWWLLIGAAYLLSLVWFVARCVISGSLPLPHGMASPEVPLPPSSAYTFGSSRMVQVQYDFNIVTPLIAVALWWACQATGGASEPGASPLHGGPAEPAGNSGVAGGPPSVS
jgi:hypothetical protein